VFAIDELTRFAAPLLPSVAILIMLARVVPYVLIVSIPVLLPAIAYHELRLTVEGPAAEELLTVFE
jgi:hypothetical protein